MTVIFVRKVSKKAERYADIAKLISEIIELLLDFIK